MSDNIVFKYGDYSMSPRPMISIQKNHVKNNNGTGITTPYSITLNGYLLGDGEYSINTTFGKMEDLREAFNNDGKLLLLHCSGTNPIISGRPRILDVSFEDGFRDQYTYSTAYTISLEMETLIGVAEDINGFNPPEYISDFNESWSITFADTLGFNNDNNDIIPMQVNVSHELSCVGKAVYLDGTPEVGVMYDAPWKNARRYIMNKLHYDTEMEQMSGILNLSFTDFDRVNNFRLVSVDESAGSVSATETYTVIQTGLGIHGTADEQFDISISKSIDEGLTRVGINGTIQGYAKINYGTGVGDFTVTKSKFASASGYWESVKNKIYYRANKVYSNMFSSGYFGRPLNTGAIAESFGVNQINGVISYTYDYNDRPSNCITGSLVENITISDSLPGDIVAQLTVLGRSAGPLLQSIGTIGPAAQRDLSVDVVVAPATGCTIASIISQSPANEVATLVSGVYNNLTGSYEQVFKVADNASWNYKTGRYTRNTSWIYQ